MNIHNRTIIVLILLVIIIVIFSLWIYVLPQLDIIKQSENNQQQLPASVIDEIEKTRLDEHSYFRRWEVNYSEQAVTIYLNFTIQTQKKPDKIVDNWRIKWETAPEMNNETTMDAYETYIYKWDMDHPQQNVSYWTPAACRNEVYVGVINISPELEGTHVIVEGWKIVFGQAS